MFIHKSTAYAILKAVIIFIVTLNYLRLFDRRYHEVDTAAISDCSDFLVYVRS